MHVNTVNTAPSVVNPSDPISGFAGIPRAMTGFAAKLRGVGYRQPYACMGVVGSREGPLEVIGERGCLVRLEAKLGSRLQK